MKAGFKSCLKLIGVITLFIVVMCAVLLPAVILPFTSAFNVASALNVTLPDTGVVGRNLLKNSDFSKNSKGDKNYTTSSTSVSIIDDWYLGVSGSSNIANYDVDSKTLTCSSKEQKGYYSNIWQLLDFIPDFLGEDIHFHVQLSSYTGNWLIQLWATNKSGSTVSLAQTNYQNTSSYLDLTYHVPLTLTSEYSNFRFLIQTRDTLSNLNVKCELGSVFTGWVPDYQDTIDDLQKQYNDLEEKYNYFIESGFMLSTLSVSSVSKLSATYRDNNHNDVTVSASRVNTVLNHNNSGPLPNLTPDSVYPYDIEYNVLYFNGNSSSTNLTDFNNGGFGLGVTVPITSFNNDLGFVPANADMTFTLNDTFLVSVGGGFVGTHANVLRFAFYGKDGRQIFLSQDTWNVGTNQILSTRGSWLDLFGSSVTSPCQFGFPEMKQSYTFNIPYDVWYIGIFMPNAIDDTNYSVGYNMTLSYQTDGSSEYIYDVGFNDGVNSVDTQKYYDEGYRIGQELGYIEGSKNQGDYTFLGLIGAAVDAPLNAFKSMFDFELLGVNLSGFILSLFTISIIIVVLKLIIGR